MKKLTMAEVDKMIFKRLERADRGKLGDLVRQALKKFKGTGRQDDI